MDITEDMFVNRLRILKADTPLRQFGAKIGVCEGTVRNYLQGKTKPKMGILQKISQEYKVSLEWLMEGEVPYSQKVVEGIVAESGSLYGKKLLPEDEKLAEIRAYVEDVLQDSPRAKRLFVTQFMKCFEEDFSPWSKTRNRATKKTESEEK